jgi:hypothetical protein
MKLIKKEIAIKDIEEMAKATFGDLVKAVVDIEKEIMVVDGDLHADEEAVLMNQGSEQKNLWGINLYPELKNEKDFIEFDSMINVRPSQNNKTRGIEDINIQNRIREIVDKLLTK